ncbi:Transient receptor potential cation channel subfamily V member 3 [Stylophora pistillata]|uniref:Transient receptor potential cation channel subfamily V member 3 n=1 Tax=Stylophora pistillata TaxID=50429 RepID=A0A2B4RA32_STYPI|nr:Transient receptor potential cation channel subfamily V member 3 [Stylophora pistillata]
MKKGCPACHGYLMSEREKELECIEKSNELRDRHEIDRCRDHQQEDLFKDEFDEDFWIKKTVVAVLDQMVNPYWPYLPQRQENYETEMEREAIEGLWNTISDDPLNYHFYYHILDGDEGGWPRKIMASDGHQQIENTCFNGKDKSCLHAIAKSNNKLSLNKKILLQAALFCIFLLFMSYSLLHASTKLDPTQYSDALDSLRGFCEVFTLLMVVFYICEEINQIRMTTGLYTQTLAKIILHDVTRYMAVFIVIFFSFCGALTLSLCYSGSRETQELRGFGDVLWSGFRALSDQYPMVEDYSTFNWLSVLLMMAYMGTVTVILLNILIAQMSTTYTQAKKVARLEYDVDRIFQLTRMERFPFLNLRVKYYKEGGWISEMNLAKELLEFSEDRNPWESVEEKLNAIWR